MRLSQTSSALLCRKGVISRQGQLVYGREAVFKSTQILVKMYVNEKAVGHILVKMFVNEKAVGHISVKLSF